MGSARPLQRWPARQVERPHSCGPHPVAPDRPIGLSSSSREVPISFRAWPACPATGPAIAGSGAPSMGFLSLRRRQIRESTHPGLPHPVRSVFRFSQPPDGFLLLDPRGFVSPHWHPWDSVLQSVLLDTCRDTLPVPDALLTLPLAVLGVLGFPLTGSWPPSGRCSRGELVHERSGVTPAAQPMLSWTSSSLGSAARGDGPAFTVPPPVCLSQPVSLNISAGGSVPACTPECRSSAVVVSSLSRAPSPSEVSRLLWSFPFGRRAFRGYPSGPSLRHRRPLPFFGTRRRPC